MLTNKQLTEIKARCEKATPGPWTYNAAEGFCNKNADKECRHAYLDEVCESCDSWRWSAPAYLNEPSVIDNGDYDGLSNENAEFIIHARTDIPMLVEEVERLEAIYEDSKKYSCPAAYYRRAVELERERDILKARCQSLEAKSAILDTYRNKYGDLSDIGRMVAELESLRENVEVADRLVDSFVRLKARCEALERALKSNNSCYSCVYITKDYNDSLCKECSTDNPKHWQFDLAGYSDQLVDADETIKLSNSKELDHIQDAPKKDKDGWVACEERLPEDTNLKLIAHRAPTGLALGLAYCGEGAWWKISDAIRIELVLGVAYWRDIPPPPEV